MSNLKITIGSRGSRLALWQANHIKEKLTLTGLESDIKIIKTKGDQFQHLSFDKIEGKGFFTKELEIALIKEEIDLAVHSLKDLETQQPKELSIAAVPIRENPSDTLLVNLNSVDKSQDLNIIKNGKIGTSSARRKNQLLDISVFSFRPLDVVSNPGSETDRMLAPHDEIIVLPLADVDDEIVEISLREDFDIYEADKVDIEEKEILEEVERPRQLLLEPIVSRLKTQARFGDPAEFVSIDGAVKTSNGNLLNGGELHLSDESKIKISDSGNFEINIDLFKKGGGASESKRLNIPLLGQIPISSAVVDSTDNGVPIVHSIPNHKTSIIYKTIIDQIISILD
mgnify:CR=1 FL=1